MLNAAKCDLMKSNGVQQNPNQMESKGAPIELKRTYQGQMEPNPMEPNGIQEPHSHDHY